MGKGIPTNMNQMVRQAQKLQEEMDALQEDLDAREYEIASGGGVCKIKINGKREVLSVEIDPQIVDPDDIETLQDIIVAGVNEAIKRVDETNKNEMQKLSGEMSFPGVAGMPSLF